MSYINEVKIQGSGGYFYQDKSSSAMPVINYEHHEIHDGNHFFYRDWTTVASSGGSIVFCLINGAGSKWTHLTYNVYSNNLVEMETFEGVTYSGGTMVTPFNNNRNAGTTWLGSLLSNPEISASGTTISRVWMGQAGAAPVSKGVVGENGRDNELILKSGTAYAWVFKVGGNDTKIGWTANWYNHTDRVQQF